MCSLLFLSHNIDTALVYITRYSRDRNHSHFEYSSRNMAHDSFNMNDLVDALLDKGYSAYQVIIVLRKEKKLRNEALKKMILLRNEIQEIRVRQTRASSSPSLLQEFIHINYQKRLDTLLQVREVLYRVQSNHFDKSFGLNKTLQHLTGGNLSVGDRITCTKNPTLSTVVTLEDTQFDFN